MRTAKRTILYLIFTAIHFLAVAATAQETRDTIVLKFEDYLAVVKEHHPVAKQANLQLAIGEANLLSARGAFDPRLFADAGQKYFNDRKYYSLLNTGLRIPTWFGLELQAGYEQNHGAFLNPEKTTPGAGLYYAGVSLPVGRNLFLDERRAELRRAKLFERISDAERQLLLNDLLYEAGTAYWNWFRAYHTVQVQQEGVANARQRLQAIRESVQFGDRRALDTIEAAVQVQTRQIDLQEAELALANSAALMEIYLWAEGTLPLEMTPNTAPPTPADLQDDDLYGALPDIPASIATHPDLRRSELQLEQLDIERRLRAERLKPLVNLKYNPILEAVGTDPFNEFNRSNYTWGLEVSLPTLMRRERGELRLAKLKIEESEFKLDFKTASLNYKAEAALNELQIVQDQINLYTQTVEFYERLLEGERELFFGGESSIFMINTREISYINAQVKLIELQTKRRKANLALQHALAALAE